MSILKIGVCSVLIVASVCAVNTAQSQPAFASCAVTLPLAQTLAAASLVFVGKVSATRNHSRTASVRVQDVWHGRHVPRRVVVRGSIAMGNAVTDVDRHFRQGVKYLFVPQPTNLRPPYQDNACTATQRYTRALAKYRPRGAHAPDGPLTLQAKTVSPPSGR